MQAYFKIVDLNNVEHNVSCQVPQFRFNEDTALGYVVKNYLVDKNDGIRDIKFIGLFKT